MTRSRPCAAAVLLALGACVTVSVTPPELEAQARAATEREEWVAAGDLWHRLYRGSSEAAYARELARALFHQGDVAGALRVLASGVAAHPEDPTLLALQGEVLVAAGQPVLAVHSYEELLALAPEDLAARRELARLQLEAGRAQDAVATLRGAAPGSDAALDLARALDLAGEQHESLEEYSRALPGHGGDPEQLLRAAELAVALSEPGSPRWLDARGWLQRVCAEDPQHLEAHRLLARVHQGLGDPDAALRELTRAAELDPTRADVLADLAELLAAAGAGERAREVALRALELDRDGELAQRLGALVEDPAQVPEEPAPQDG